MSPIGFNNPKIQRLRRLLGRRSSRFDEHAFVIEGAVLVTEALAAGLELEAVYVEVSSRSVVLASPPAGVPVIEVADGVLTRVSSTVTGQPIVAVAPLLHGPVPPDASFVVVCAGVSDPGNAGTIMRSAEAAGADAVLFTTGSVDVYNPKCVRASAGALFHVPVVVEGDPRGLSLPLVGAAAVGGVPHDQFDLSLPLALVLGNEAHGLPVDLALDAMVSIVHTGRAESLNVAMAATVVCFEVARQRRGGPRSSAVDVSG